MNRFLLVFFVLVNVRVYSQSAAKIQQGYKDFVLDNKTIWLLTNSGTLNVINQASGKTVTPTITTDAPIVAIAKDREGNIVIGDTTHQIKQYDKRTKLWHNIYPYFGKLTGIVFNSQNQCLLVTWEGIVDPISQVTYFPDSTYSSNESYWLRKKRWMATPVYFMDSHDQLWLGLDYGEWGGDVFAFDTKKRQFIRLQTDSIQMSLNPVVAFCEDKQNVYMACGCDHMSMNHSSIVRFNRQIASSLLVSDNKEKLLKVTPKRGADRKQKEEIRITWTGGHLISSCAYNPTINCLYFSSQYGIYKGSPATDLSDMKQWKNIVKLSARWNEGRRTLLKMACTPEGTLFFLAEFEGLGIYTNKALRFIK